MGACCDNTSGKNKFTIKVKRKKRRKTREKFEDMNFEIIENLRKKPVF